MNPTDEVGLPPGRWVRRGGVLYFVAAPKPSQAKVKRTWAQEKRYDWRNLGPCAYCGADAKEPCRSANDRNIVPAHRVRCDPKGCATCQVEIRSTKTYCDDCFIKRRRAQWREKARRKKERLAAEVTAPSPITTTDDELTCRRRLAALVAETDDRDGRWRAS